MRFKNILSALTIVISIVFTSSVYAQTLDSEFLIENLKNSSDNLFKEYLKRYDDYLKQHPNDIKIQIEKCKFLQNAKYDYEEDYNPNQEAADSCSAALVKAYPLHPDVLIFQTTYKWGDELNQIFDDAQSSIQKNPKAWTDENLAELYISMSNKSFFDEDFDKAYIYLQKAILKNAAHKATIQHARILHKLKKDKEALKIVLLVNDSSLHIWDLIQKAELLLELKAYEQSLEIYDKIRDIDSTYNNNTNTAHVLENVGQYDLARTFLVADTVLSWQKEISIRNLLIHDLKFQDGKKCIDSYNKYKELRFSNDLLGIYRLKIFFSHPLQPWTFKDIISVLLLLIVFILMVFIPSIWILPVYFIGHKWNFLSRTKPFISIWGLKSFWFVSFGFLFATFTTLFIEPDLLYSSFDSSYYAVELSQEKNGLIAIVFIFTLAIFAFATLYNTNLKVLLSSNWTIRKSILMSIGIMFIYKIISGIYIRIGVNLFDVTVDNLANIQHYILTTRQDIIDIIAFTGKGNAFLIICFLVPVYEEIIFRGVILDSCQRYTNFQLANFIQATLFAVVHMNLFLFPVFLSFGIITGILRKRSNGLLGGIVFHIFNNILAMSFILLK